MNDAHKEDDADVEKKVRSPSPAVKSRAVVKYTSVRGPVGFARLQCNTDLNRPPAAWLSSVLHPYGYQRILAHDTGFSSFRMAHMFPDSVGEVDVIAGAECIKTLLKLPYQPNSNVSMMVHRVDNTLLLDEFDMRSRLLQADWEWLRVFQESVATAAERNRPRDPPSPLLADKFLCHSVSQQPAVGFPLPEPDARTDQSTDGGADSDQFSRNVLWTFEDIQMLIGSNLPIFGSAERPCVSLRLRDATQPINVLTGIDYWLDNLMCNVPEVLMCYHIDGIVQKYEPMKTEELPNLEGSKFSPKVIRNVAQNILSFLKSNATKSGHTYWLFKGTRDDVVKLYDLTSLCGGLGSSSGDDNPFTTPVGMLLYRVARNVRLKRRTRHVKQLLENALGLLHAETHPHVVASAHYMLADLYLPPATDPAAPLFNDESESDDEEEEFDDEGEKSEKASREGSPDDKSDVITNQQSKDDKTSLVKEKDAHTHYVDTLRNDEDTIGHDIDTVGNNKDKYANKEVAAVIDEETTSQLALEMRGLALQDIGKSIQPSNQSKSPRETGGAMGREPPERCGRALRHALLGLQALAHVKEDTVEEEEVERERQQRLLEEQNPKMANPCEPISMDYAPLKTEQHIKKEAITRGRRRKRRTSGSDAPVDRNAISVRPERVAHPAWREPAGTDSALWKTHLQTLLYEKICLAYATLAEYSYSREQYGFSLKYLVLAARGQRLAGLRAPDSRVVSVGCLRGRAGDNYLQISKHWSRLEQFRQQLETDHETDRQLRQTMEAALREHGAHGQDEIEELHLPSSMTDALVQSRAQYVRALAACEPSRRHELLRRQASVTNELAVRYMHAAQDAYLKHVNEEDADGDGERARTSDPLGEHRSLLAQSLACLDEATELFREVDDVPNLALLLCNKGRYMRLRAHCQPDQGDEGGEEQSWWHWYTQAEQQYSQALRVLGGRAGAGCSAVRDLVLWELSSAAYARASLRHDRAAGQEDSQVVIDALKNALKHCDLSPGKRQYLYQFRAAMIYHRLGSLYHKLYRSCDQEGVRRRTLMSLARSNYERACELLAVLEECALYLTVALEHVAALENRAGASSSVKLKSLQSALTLIRRCGSVLRLMSTDCAPAVADTHSVADTPSADTPTTDERSLLALLTSRLQIVLKSLIQYCRGRSNKDYDKMAAAYKQMYGASLKMADAPGPDLKEYAKELADVVQQIDEISEANSL